MFWNGSDMARHGSWWWIAPLLGLLLANHAAAAEQRLTCPLGREYFLYAPAKVEPDITYWLVAGIHGLGSNGQGAGGLSAWIDHAPCIVVGPTMPNGYQVLLHDTDQQLIGIAAVVAKKYRLHDKLFVAGFSAGAQFAHRFTIKHPAQVVGCAAHSGGTWNGSVSPAARNVLFAISCGQDDKDRSTPDAAMTRIDWAHQFAGLLSQNGHVCKIRFWPKVGHAASPGSAQLSEDCFLLSTTGCHAPQLKFVQTKLKGIEQQIERRQFGDALPQIEKLPNLEVPISLVGWKLPEGDKLAGLDEDPYGWHLGSAGDDVIRRARRAYLHEQAAGLMLRAERAAVAQINELAAKTPADAAQQIALLERLFANRNTVATAARQALAKIKP